MQEKKEWLDKYLPEIDEQHRVFTICGQDKKDFIEDGVRPTDFLLDDYTQNLSLWEPPAKGIKLLNGINHTNETWQSTCISFDKSANEIANNISNVMLHGEQIIDKKPLDKKISFVQKACQKESSKGFHLNNKNEINKDSGHDL